MNRVHIDMRKWPDHLHWQYEAVRLGDDEHGAWLHVPTGSQARRGGKPSRPLDTGFIQLVPHDEWWIVAFYTNHPEIAVYVNIGTPPIWHGDTVSHVDLDLDVVRKIDGTVVVLDMDEFIEHQLVYSYPPNLIAGAKHASDTAVEMVQRSDEPFGVAARSWIASVDPATLR